MANGGIGGASSSLAWVSVIAAWIKPGTMSMNTLRRQVAQLHKATTGVQRGSVNGFGCVGGEREDGTRLQNCLGGRR